MRRESSFNKTKLYSASNNKSVADIYVDSFAIEKVHIRLAEYERPKEFIDIYFDFANFLYLAEEVKSGKILRKISDLGKPENIKYGGRPASRAKRDDGNPEAYSVTLAISKNKYGNYIAYLNAQVGPGKETETGAFAPNGPADNKVSVSMSIEKLKEFFLYGAEGVRAYMPFLIKELVNNARVESNSREEY